MAELNGAGGKRAGAGRKPVGSAAEKKPRGRPKGSKDKQQRETRALGQTLPADASAVLSRMVEERKDELLKNVIDMALGGDRAMMQYVLDQTIGKPGTKTVNNPDTTIIIRTMVPRPGKKTEEEEEGEENAEPAVDEEVY